MSYFEIFGVFGYVFAYTLFPTEIDIMQILGYKAMFILELLLMLFPQLVLCFTLKRNVIKRIPLYYLIAECIYIASYTLIQDSEFTIAAAIFAFFVVAQAVGIILAWGVYYLVGFIKKKRKKADACAVGETAKTTESSETNE